MKSFYSDRTLVEIKSTYKSIYAEKCGVLIDLFKSFDEDKEYLVMDLDVLLFGVNHNVFVKVAK